MPVDAEREAASMPEVSGGWIDVRRELEHRTHKWEPVLRAKMLKIRILKHRT